MIHYFPKTCINILIWAIITHYFPKQRDLVHKNMYQHLIWAIITTNQLLNTVAYTSNKKHFLIVFHHKVILSSKVLIFMRKIQRLGYFRISLPAYPSFLLSNMSPSFFNKQQKLKREERANSYKTNKNLNHKFFMHSWPCCSFSCFIPIIRY